MDFTKILGSVIASQMSKGGGNNNILSNVLGAALGGGTSAGSSQGGGLSDILGGLASSLGKGSGQSSSGQASNDNPLAGLLGGLMNSGASSSANSSSNSGGLGDLLGGLLGGGKSGGGLDIGSILSQISGDGQSQSSSDLGKLVMGAMNKLNGDAGNTSDDNAGDIFSSKTTANEQAEIMLEAMINAAKADGKIDAQEQAKIIDSLGSEISEEEAQYLNDLAKKPLDTNGFINRVPKKLQTQAYIMSLTAIQLDSQEEGSYLHKLAQGFGMDAGVVNRIHEQSGAPKLYSQA